MVGLGPTVMAVASRFRVVHPRAAPEPGTSEGVPRSIATHRARYPANNGAWSQSFSSPFVNGTPINLSSALAAERRPLNLEHSSPKYKLAGPVARTPIERVEVGRSRHRLGCRGERCYGSV